MSDPPQADPAAKPFLDHLEELRWTFLKSGAALLVGMIVAGCFSPQLVQILTRPLAEIGYDPGEFLRSLKVGGAISVIIRVAGWGGLLLCLPFIVFFVGQFVMPGLHHNEKKILYRASAFSVVLFALGVLLGYFVCMPIALRFMLRAHDWIGAAPEWTINDYVAFSVQMLIGFGLAFQLPIVLLGLAKLGLVDTARLKAHRPHAIIACLVAGMFLTPSDLLSMFVLAAPLYLLFELCIGILYLEERRTRRERDIDSSGDANG